jgi:hypothetical protein
MHFHCVERADSLLPSDLDVMSSFASRKLCSSSAKKNVVNPLLLHWGVVSQRHQNMPQICRREQHLHRSLLFRMASSSPKIGATSLGFHPQLYLDFRTHLSVTHRKHGQWPMDLCIQQWHHLGTPYGCAWRAFQSQWRSPRPMPCFPKQQRQDRVAKTMAYTTWAGSGAYSLKALLAGVVLNTTSCAMQGAENSIM